MAPRVLFRCSSCEATAPKWMGRCSSCGAWDTLAEVPAGTGSTAASVGPPVTAAIPIDQVPVPSLDRLPTAVSELDTVLGGGLVPGSVTLLAGEPGIGKSTLTLQIANGLAAGGRTVLLISGEESASQVRLRAERLGALRPRVLLASEHDLDQVIAQIDAASPDAVVIDSVQTIAAADLAGAPGSVSQVSGCAARLAALAKTRDVPLVLVGHVTKDGGLAGPRTLEHLVDTVLTFEGDRHHSLRLLRAVKHRFGSTDELGVLEMTASGLEAVSDPSSLFLADRRQRTSGSVVTATIDGHRPLLVEVQALVTPNHAPPPRRSAQGFDTGRLSMLLAVLSARARAVPPGVDVYALVVGGMRVTEPAADLALALAVVSSASDIPLDPDVVVCGEVGLGGEVRQVRRLERRLAEAARLGFRRAIVPVTSPSVPGIDVIGVATLREAVTWLRNGVATDRA